MSGGGKETVKSLLVVAFHLVVWEDPPPEVTICQESDAYQWVDATDGAALAAMDVTEGTRFVVGKYGEWVTTRAWQPL